MPLARLTTQWSLFCATALLAACGGNTSKPAPSPTTVAAPAPQPAPDVTPPPPPPPMATLTLSLSSLGLMASGATRTVTITNLGPVPALNVVLSVGPTLPPGTTTSPASCASLAPGAACVLTVTPGATPSALRGDTAPEAVSLAVAGSNTNTATLQLHVLALGSVYQGGYVFDLDDSTASSGSVGGKVAALSDAGTDIKWATDASGAPAQTLAPGTDDVNGAANTAAMLAALPASPGNHAAGVCKASAAGGYTDWYLPALCELGTGPHLSCGSVGAPRLPNLDSHLQLLGDTGLLRGPYWSSTEMSGSVFAWVQHFDPLGSQQFANDKQGNGIQVRCVRALVL